LIAFGTYTERDKNLIVGRLESPLVGKKANSFDSSLLDRVDNHPDLRPARSSVCLDVSLLSAPSVSRLRIMMGKSSGRT
jgi:hypothetical protein